MNIGILGGSFDPIHNGHLRIAALAKYKYKLGKVLFVPLNKPWLKKRKTFASSTQRMAMCEVALKKYKSFLEDVHLLKKNNNSLQVEDKTLLINSLYSRDLGGTCSGENHYDFTSKKNLIICEGHYTSRSEFRNLIDLNIYKHL